MILNLPAFIPDDGSLFLPTIKDLEHVDEFFSKKEIN